MSAADGPQSARGVGGSSRRVGFGSGGADGHVGGGSARRANGDVGASYGHVGSSSRKVMGAAASPSMGGGGGGSLSALSAEQQSATHSAVSMNSIFSEARREIRRGLHRDSAIRTAEAAAAKGGDYARVDAGVSPAGHTPTTPKTPATTAAGGGEEEAAEESNELTWKTDVTAMREMLQSNYILSALLLCIPLGIVAHFTGLGGVSSAFILNFLAIIPLAWLLGNATEELALRSNQTLGGLLNATFGNAVELIVSIVALRKGMIKIVQTSLLGSILSNCLLVLGMAFMLGGMTNKVQVYNQKGAHMLSSLLLLASIALVLPAAFVNSFQPHPSMNHLLRISRVTALLMFILYILYLYFQLFTHAEMFDDESSSDDDEDEEDGENSNRGYQQQDREQQQQRNNNARNGGKKQQQQKAASYAAAAAHGAEVASSYQASSRARDGASHNSLDDDVPLVEEVAVQPVSESMKELSDLEAPHHSSSRMPASIAEDNESSGSAEHVQQHDEDDQDDENDDEEDNPQMTLASSIGLLVAVTLAVAVCSEFLVDSIEEVTQAWGMNVSFVGLILLPIVGNAAEHATAVTVAMKNKMDLAIGVAIGSSTQIALFLIPFVTLLGWVIDQPMSLNFSSFETIVLVVAVLMVSALLKNGESNWLQGVMLMTVYVIIATVFVYVPERTDNPKFQNHHQSWQPTVNEAGASAHVKHI